MLQVLKRLKGRSANELRTRAQQAIHAYAERSGWSSLTRLPEDQVMLRMYDPQLTSSSQALDDFRKRVKTSFFGGFLDRSATLAELRARWPETEAEIVSRANRIVEGRFDLLGFRDLSFGDPIDWHLEPISGKRAQLLHWSKLDYLESALVGDKKITWELNRHQYFARLGQAYWLTGDERYARTFVAHIESWIAANPPKFGINWVSSLEISFRSISWLWGLAYFLDSPALTARFFFRVLKVLYLSGLHLENYLSTYFAPNTHLSGEALGLYYLGTLLPDLRSASRWRRTGTDILLSCLARHVRPDGVYFEQSSYYHRYTTDFYGHLVILSRRNQQALPGVVEKRLALLLNHLMHITRPDGSSPLFGDDDGGRLAMLDGRSANDFRAALSTGAVLLGRGDYKYVAGGIAEETLWLLGLEGIREFDLLLAQEPNQCSMGFSDGGYYIMRDGWKPTSNYLVFDCGPHGGLNNAHSHADALSFDLAVGGRLVLQDPGTYTYTGSSEMRDLFRDSKSHNTVTLDDQPQSVPGGPFTWQTVARCQLDTWISRQRVDFVSGRHDGYARLADPAILVRSILFLKNDYWIIRDQLISAGKHHMDIWFHFTAIANPLIEGSEAALIAEGNDESGLDIVSFDPKGRWKREEGWVSHCYGQKRAARVFAFSGDAGGNNEVITFMLPRRRASRYRVREIEAIGGCAFEVTHGQAVDVVMIRSGVGVETARFASDFDWAWARFVHVQEPEPAEVVLLGGTTLRLDGQQMFSSSQRMDYVAGTRTGNEYQVERSAGVVELELGGA